MCWTKLGTQESKSSVYVFILYGGTNLPTVGMIMDNHIGLIPKV